MKFVPPVGRLGIVLCRDRSFRTRFFLQFASALAADRVPFPFPNPAPDGPCNPEMRGRCRKFDVCAVRKEENEPLIPASEVSVSVALAWGAKPAPRVEDFCPHAVADIAKNRYDEKDWSESDIGLSDSDYSLTLYNVSDGKDVSLEEMLTPYEFVFLGPLWTLFTDSPKLVLKRLCALAERCKTGIVLAAGQDDKLLEPCMEAFSWRMEIGERFRWRGGNCERGWEVAVYDGDTLVRKKVPVIYDAERGYIRIASCDEF